MRTVRMFVLSPLVTAASASASSAPAFSRSSRSNPDPTMQGPSQSLRRRKALVDLSRTATEWPSELSERVRPDPTRPHPTTMTCTPQCNTPRRVLQKPGLHGRRLLLLCARGDPDHRDPVSGAPAPGPPARRRGGGDPRDPPLPLENKGALGPLRHP